MHTSEFKIKCCPFSFLCCVNGIGFPFVSFFLRCNFSCSAFFFVYPLVTFRFMRCLCSYVYTCDHLLESFYPSGFLPSTLLICFAFLVFTKRLVDLLRLNGFSLLVLAIYFRTTDVFILLIFIGVLGKISSPILTSLSSLNSLVCFA